MNARKIFALLFAIGLCAWSTPAAALPPYIHQICVKLRTGYLDGATGDYGTGAVWVGRGVKVGTPFSAPTYASTSDGCLTVVAPGPALGQITIYAESRVGVNDNLFVRSFPTRAAMNTWDGVRTDGNLSKWIINGPVSVCAGNFCQTTVTNTASSTEVVSNLHAAAAWSLHHIDADSPSHLGGSHEMLVHNSSCSSGDGGSCMEEGRILSIQTLNTGSRRKFLIAHEAGHWWHANWGGSFGGSYAVSDPEGTACDSVGIPGDHALRSLEYQKAAYIEGFAHYLSTLAFNDHASTSASFQYYKIFVPGGYNNEVVNVEVGPTGGDTNWWANGCGCPGCDSGEPNVDGDNLATELDWLRTFWDFRTDGPVNTQPSHNDVFDVVATSVGQKTAYDDLTDEVPAALLARWSTATSNNGVNH